MLFRLLAEQVTADTHVGLDDGLAAENDVLGPMHLGPARYFVSGVLRELDVRSGVCYGEVGDGGNYGFYVFSLDSLGRHACDILLSSCLWERRNNQRELGRSLNLLPRLLVLDK